MSKFINIKFPFKDSPKGFFFDLTETNNDAIKSDLLHLVLTNKGSRLYKPEFGTNLMRMIFEPNDGITQGQIKEELDGAIKRYMPNLKINTLTVVGDTTNEHLAKVEIHYTVSDDVFEQNDSISINI